MPNGNFVKIERGGKCVLTKDLVIKDVVFVPDFKFNLQPVSKLAKDNGSTVLFTRDVCFIQDLASKSIQKTGKRSVDL